MKKLTSLSKKDFERNTKVYDVYFNQIKWIDGWEGEDKVENFERMLQITKLTDIPLQDKMCLDVGCGTGDLLPLLKHHGIKGYAGIDIYPPAIVMAHQKYPDDNFILGDLLTGIIEEKFDYTFSSGALSVKLPTNNYDFLEAMVAKMWELTRIGLAFNCYIDEDREPDPDLFYYNFDRLMDICYSIAENAKVYTAMDRKLYQVHVYMYNK